MKFDEQRLKALEQALAPDFFVHLLNYLVQKCKKLNMTVEIESLN